VRVAKNVMTGFGVDRQSSSSSLQHDIPRFALGGDTGWGWRKHPGSISSPNPNSKADIGMFPPMRREKWEETGEGEGRRKKSTLDTSEHFQRFPRTRACRVGAPLI